MLETAFSRVSSISLAAGCFCVPILGSSCSMPCISAAGMHKTLNACHVPEDIESLRKWEPCTDKGLADQYGLKRAMQKPV